MKIRKEKKMLEMFFKLYYLITMFHILKFLIFIDLNCLSIVA